MSLLFLPDLFTDSVIQIVIYSYNKIMYNTIIEYTSSNPLIGFIFSTVSCVSVISWTSTHCEQRFQFFFFWPASSF
jgi:hypothetical protein